MEMKQEKWASVEMWVTLTWAKLRWLGIWFRTSPSPCVMFPVCKTSEPVTLSVAGKAHWCKCILWCVCVTQWSCCVSLRLIGWQGAKSNLWPPVCNSQLSLSPCDILLLFMKTKAKAKNDTVCLYGKKKCTLNINNELHYIELVFWGLGSHFTTASVSS